MKILWFLLDCRVYSTFSHPWARYDCLPELSRALQPSRGDQIILDSRLHLEDSGEFLFLSITPTLLQVFDPSQHQFSKMEK